MILGLFISIPAFPSRFFSRAAIEAQSQVFDTTMSGVRCLRRLYSTKGKSPPFNAPSTTDEGAIAASNSILPVAAAAARRSSTPMAVRLRRIKANRDQLKAGLTASEEDTFGRLRNTTAGSGLTYPTNWALKMHERRSRIRGLKEAAPDDQLPGVIDIGSGLGYAEGRVRIVGKRVYLPNFIIQLVRNRTPAGTPYNPFEATFRIPKNLTKNDLRSYLFFVYGVKTTYIRTDNYIGSLSRNPARQSMIIRDKKGTFKRAVVGLVDAFYPPNMLDDMAAQEREAVDKELKEEFDLEQIEGMRDEQIHIVRQRDTPFIPGLATSRAKIMKKVLEKRREREALLTEKVEEMMKNKGKSIRIRV